MTDHSHNQNEAPYQRKRHADDRTEHTRRIPHLNEAVVNDRGTRAMPSDELGRLLAMRVRAASRRRRSGETRD
jgi:hypothetical protein